jgi:hypothetical protein
MIRVRLARPEDQADLIDFIRDHWSSTHIFTQAPDLFAWQYRQPDGRLNMMMAENVTDDERSVIGVLGFIPMGRFDDALGDQDVTLAIWKVRDGAPPGVGLRLLKQLQAELQPRMIAAIGISDIVVPIYRVLGYEVATLGHAAIFNPDRQGRLRIADHVPSVAFTRPAPEWPDNVHLTLLDERAADDLQIVVDQLGAEALPAKSWEYVATRFLLHPWYDYSVSLVHHDEVATAVVVWRTVTAEGTRALRIVDIIGATAWLADARRVLLAQVIEADAEYIDLMHWGIDSDTLAAAGFVGPHTHEGIVIPNYFSPFERHNIEIDLAYKLMDQSDSPLHLYRADSDQDRPNTPSDLIPTPRGR